MKMDSYSDNAQSSLVELHIIDLTAEKKILNYIDFRFQVDYFRLETLYWHWQAAMEPFHRQHYQNHSQVSTSGSLEHLKNCVNISVSRRSVQYERNLSSWSVLNHNTSFIYNRRQKAMRSYRNSSLVVDVKTNIKWSP